MRLTKYFGPTKFIDRNINSWVKESPKQRFILQVAPYKDGVIVLYEKFSPPKNEWESIKRGLIKKGNKTGV